MRFTNEWGPASIISLIALVGGCFFAYFNDGSEMKTRMVRVETEVRYIAKTVDKIELKLDRTQTGALADPTTLVTR